MPGISASPEIDSFEPVSPREVSVKLFTCELILELLYVQTVWKEALAPEEGRPARALTRLN